jgi:soluble lytic murein transglycosylase-like protein
LLEGDVRKLVGKHSVDARIPLRQNLLEALLLAQIKQESAFDEGAISPVGAMGLAQFMPGTWEVWGTGGDPFNPDHSIKAQVRYMEDLYSRFGEIPDLIERYKFALASYNAGRGHVNKALAEAREACNLPYSYGVWQSEGAKSGRWQEWWYASSYLHLITGKHALETLQYVSKIFNYTLSYLSNP